MKAVPCVSHPHAHCEISLLKDRIDLIGKSYVLVSYFDHHSTHSHMHSGHLGKKKMRSWFPGKRVMHRLALNVFTIGTALRVVSVISTWIFSRFCLLMKTNSAAQGCVSSAHGFTGHSPVLLYNLFPFSIKRCWIQLLFIVFMTTTLILFFFSFSQTKKCSEV